MIQTKVLIIGGGSAGMSAALAAAEAGADVLLLERDYHLGGRLSQQTQRFMSFPQRFAGERGFVVAQKLCQQVEDQSRITVWVNSPALGIYTDGIVTCLHNNEHIKIKPQQIIAACGAIERFAAFYGNDLPGVYGAGAVQSLMNVQGVLPAQRVLILGSNDLGLQFAYQLLQAGADVAAVVEPADSICGSSVYAARLRRAGVPILTHHNVYQACGKKQVEKAKIVPLDNLGRPDKEHIFEMECDAICLAVGLQPRSQILHMAGCKFVYDIDKRAILPLTDEHLQTSVAGVYAVGAVADFSCAADAIIAGDMAGNNAAIALGYAGEVREDNEQRNDKTEGGADSDK